MPRHATRLEAWRLGPGRAPEQIAIGEPDETTATILATITFSEGAMYQLWLVAHNSRDRSEPSPVASWVAE